MTALGQLYNEPFIPSDFNKVMCEKTELKAEVKRLKFEIAGRNRIIDGWKRDFNIKVNECVKLENRISDNESTFMAIASDDSADIKALTMSEARMIVQNTFDMSKEWHVYEVVRKE